MVNRVSSHAAQRRGAAGFLPACLLVHGQDCRQRSSRRSQVGARTPFGASHTVSTDDSHKLHEFLGRALVDLGGAVNAVLMSIGDELGLYKALADFSRIVVRNRA
jgi:hypothetical protein